MSTGFLQYSICIPCFNEAEALPKVMEDILTNLYELEKPFEVIVVDDGSQDGTEALLGKLADREARILYLRFDHNVGYGQALKTAVGATRGRLVATLDSDGQFTLDDLPDLLKTMDTQQLQVVSGVRQKDDQRLSARGGDGLIRLLTHLFHGVKATDPQCAFKLYEGELLRHIARNLEPAGFLTPTLWVMAAQRLGAAIGNCPVTHRPRLAGESKIRALRHGSRMLMDVLALRKKVEDLPPLPGDAR